LNRIQRKVEALLTKTRNDLCQIISDNRTAARPDQADALNVILSKVANATEKSRDFGIAVKDLLKKLDLHDADVLDQHYSGLNPPGSWADLLSQVGARSFTLGFCTFATGSLSAAGLSSHDIYMTCANGSSCAR
jgi:hypothetical protein